MARRQMANGWSFSKIPGTLGNQVSDCSNKFWIGPDSSHPRHSHAELFADVSGFGVQVELDLHVVGNEADWSDSHLSGPAGVQLANRITHIRF